MPGRLIGQKSLFVFDGYLNEFYEWRIKETLPVRHFLQVKLLIVSLNNFGEDGVVRPPGLYDHFALGFSASCSPRHLGDLLESPFTCSKIGEIQNAVSIHDPYHRDLIEIQALGDHLRADQDINITRAKVFQQAL